MYKFLFSLFYMSLYLNYLYSQTNTWTGATDTDWHKACNWSLGIIPTCAHDVVIPNVTNYPIISNIAHCNKVDITSTATDVLTIQNSPARLDVGLGGSCSGTPIDNGGCLTGPYCISTGGCGGATMTDSRDSKVYNIVDVGSQCWMAQDLNHGTYLVGGAGQTNNGTIEKFCNSNVVGNCTTYGGLYKWNEMMAYGAADNGNGPGPQGICPAGWHLPTDNEWKCMEMNLGMSQVQADAIGYRGTSEGGALKQTGISLWASPNEGATNSTSFTSVPGGAWRANISSWYSPSGWGMYWTASTIGSDPIYRWTSFSVSTILRNSLSDPNFGFSVRCVKD